MVRIDVTYRGELRSEAVHAPSGEQLVTDAPVDNQGRGESFSPTDLVATALGTCMVTVMGIVAQRRGWTLGAVTASVEKKMVTEPARKIGALEVVITVPGEFDPQARETLERAARSCPVALTLEGAVSMPVRFAWSS